MRVKMARGLVAIAAALLLGGCGDPLAFFTAKAKTAPLTLNFAMSGAPASRSLSSSARTILPGIGANATTFVVTLSSYSGFGTRTETVEPSAAMPKGLSRFPMGTVPYSFTIPSVEVGDWLVTVEARAGSLTFGTGSADHFSVTASGSSTSLIPIYPSDPAATPGAGDISIPIRVGTALGTWTVDVTLLDSARNAVAAGARTGAALSFVSMNEDFEYQYSVTGLSAGTYTAIVSFKRDGAPAGTFSEAINVYPGLASSAWIDGSGYLQSSWFFSLGQLLETDASLASLMIMDSTGTPLAVIPSLLTECDIGDIKLTSAIRFYAMPSATDPVPISYTWNGSAPAALTSDHFSPHLALQTGLNTLVVTVTSPNGAATKTYTTTLRLPATTMTGPTAIKMVGIDGGAFRRDSTGLVAEYLFEGIVSNKATDTSGKGNDATATPALALTNDHFGGPGRAALINGTGDYLSVPGDLTPASSSFTWASWIYVPAYPGTTAVFMEQGGAPGAYGNCRSLSVSPDGHLEFYLYSTSGQVNLVSTKVLSTGTWYFVAGVYDGTNCSLFVDGALDAQTPFNLGYTPASYFYIGANVPYSNFVFSGKVDDVRVYDRALAPPEVAAIYSSPAGSVNDVRVSSFLLGSYEVTQTQWRAVASTTYPAGTADTMIPITNITWYDMAGFCNKLSLLEGLDPVYTIMMSTVPWNGVFPVPTAATVTADWTRNGYRLPTNAEWTWAMMGGTRDEMYTGGGVDTKGFRKQFAGDNGARASSINSYAWTGSSSYPYPYTATTQTVGQKLPNELGIYDMSGNASEWCWDDTTLTIGPLVDYRGGGSTTSTSQHLLRGGNYGQWPPFNSAPPNYFGPDYQTATPDTSNPAWGFRVARNYPGSGGAGTGTMVVIPDPGPYFAISGLLGFGFTSSASYSVVGTSFDEYSWYVNGKLITQYYDLPSASMLPASGSTIVLSPSVMQDLYIGPNRLMAKVRKGAIWYSEEMTVTLSGGGSA